MSEAAALADALEDPRYCLGCGHDERVKIMAPAFACCPDRSYMSVGQMILKLNNFKNENRELLRQIEGLNRVITRLRLEHEPAMPKGRVY